MVCNSFCLLLFPLSLFPHSSMGPSQGLQSFRINLLLHRLSTGPSFLQEIFTFSTTGPSMGCSVNICSTVVISMAAGESLLQHLAHLLPSFSDFGANWAASPICSCHSSLPCSVLLFLIHTLPKAPLSWPRGSVVPESTWLWWVHLSWLGPAVFDTGQTQPLLV